MLRRDHQIAALALVTNPLLLTTPSLTWSTTVTAVTLTLILAVLPDVDRYLPGCHHRGFSHTLWAWLLVTGGLSLLPLSPLLRLVGSLSYLAHLVIDSRSIANLRWLGPLTANPADSKYGIAVGVTPTGQIKHHHGHYRGYRVGGSVEAGLTILFLISDVISCAVLWERLWS